MLALEEMTAAEKAHGYISRATDQDPYLARVREAVAREAESYGASYPEGQGPGLRYTAFDRHASLARQTVARLQESQKSLAGFRAGLKPLDPTEQQLRGFRQVFDAIPWSDVRDTLHAPVEVPAVPAYSAFVDRAASGQEDLVIAFTELLSAPTSRHVIAFTLAAFIDLIVFLLAYASGPFFFGSPEERWLKAGAALDAADEQVFARGPPAQGLGEHAGPGPDRGRGAQPRRAAARPAARLPGPRRPRRGGGPALLPARRRRCTGAWRSRWPTDGSRCGPRRSSRPAARLAGIPPPAHPRDPSNRSPSGLQGQ